MSGKSALPCVPFFYFLPSPPLLLPKCPPSLDTVLEFHSSAKSDRLRPERVEGAFCSFPPHSSRSCVFDGMGENGRGGKGGRCRSGVVTSDPVQEKELRFDSCCYCLSHRSFGRGVTSRCLHFCRWSFELSSRTIFSTARRGGKKEQTHYTRPLRQREKE